MQKDKAYKKKLANQKTKKELMVSKSGKKNEKTIDIVMIDTTSFDLLSRDKEVEIFAISLKNVNYELKKKFKKIINPKDVVFQKYHDFLNVFFKKETDILFLHRKYDHKIELIKNKKTFIHVSFYRMSKNELQIIKNYFEEHLNKGFIIFSSVFFASPILFAKKSNDELRFCVDFRKLNDVTKKNRYSLSFIIDLMIRLSKAKFFNKIDIRHAFNRIRLASKMKENFIIFRIRFGSYKYLMMSFELTNGSTIFQIFINDILMNYLNDFVIIYLDDIFVYNDNMKNHGSHVRKMLQKFREIDIQIDVDKCEFYVIETKFLKIIIKQNDLRMNPKKILTIKKGKIFQDLQQIQFFLRFINFYKRFIKGFSIMIKPLNKLIKKDVLFEGTKDCQSAFNQLKKRVIEISVLTHFDSSLEIIVESDSFDYVSADVLFQKNKNDIIRSVTFFSKSLLFAECNYEIYDKKLLTIIRCFEKWRPKLQSIEKFIKMLTDHKSLKYFMTTKKLNKRQAK